MPRQNKDGDMINTRTGQPVNYKYPATVRNEPAGVFDWGSVDASVLSAAVAAVTARGHAASFAVNRSGSTGCITILAGAERPKYYAETVSEAEDILMALTL